ncbi:MAG: NAD(P)/FAD-dependent oxidoreductase [Actinobacteria bacterium]|nr:MAG: NAD(P)/FAD-dependent oxidoreductase [Actinomycetota bacterium]
MVVVGASLAGLRAVETLRQHGYDGRLVLVGAEPSLPYDRPPLSKQVLAGEWGPDEIVLRPADDYSSLALDMRLGRRATALDLDARAVVLDDGERVAFDGLVIATGCRPRLLPGTPDIAGIHVLRTLDDALAIRAALDAAARVVVIGAGFIGSEVAATCRMSGLDVTLLEALPVPLARALGDEMGAACAELHRDNGVDLRVVVAPAGFDGDEQVERVRLSDGSAIDADVVVVGVGVAPETAWLEGSGLALGDGVLCDASCFASAPGVVAAGDVARWHNPLFGVDMRVEHWTNAAEQGMAAARALLAGAGAEPFAPVPYFWSDQYDAKIQFVGTCAPDDEVRIVHGSVAERRFVAIYGRAGRLVGALALSRPRLLVAYRRLIAERASWEDALAHEPT